MVGVIVASPGMRKFAVKAFWDWVYHQNGEGGKENPQDRTPIHSSDNRLCGWDRLVHRCDLVCARILDLNCQKIVVGANAPN